MSSPFSTFKEFSEAKGSIYTFADNPIVTTFFLILSLVIIIYFIYASFHLRKKQPSTKSNNPAVMGILAILGTTASLISLVDRYPSPPSQPKKSSYQVQQTKAWQALPILSAIGIDKRGLRLKKAKRSPYQNRKRF